VFTTAAAVWHALVNNNNNEATTMLNPNSKKNSTSSIAGTERCCVVAVKTSAGAGSVETPVLAPTYLQLHSSPAAPALASDVFGPARAPLAHKLKIQDAVDLTVDTCESELPGM